MMNATALSRNEGNALRMLASVGFLVPNGMFLYFVLTDPVATRAAFTNPISLLFISEAFFLMLIFAWLLKRTESRRPSACGFVVMSVVGSLAFSVPAALYLLMSREKEGGVR